VHTRTQTAKIEDSFVSFIFRRSYNISWEKGFQLLRKVVSVIMLMMLLISAQPLVFAAKFNLGDTVEVFNTGASGLLVRDAPAGNIIGKKYDGNRGMVLAGPQTASLGGVVYTWWKVRWGDDALEGWSAEDYLKYVYITPSTKFSIGNLVKVSTGGPSLIVRTDPPPSSDLSYKGSVADGTVGKVLGGPFYGVPQGASGFYYFWKVDYLSIVGWSAEDWLTKVVGEPVITSSLVLVQSPPYYVGNTITARFTITNRATAPFTFDVLTVGGRDPDNQVADFTWIRSITLNPSASYNYQGTLTLTKVGNYHFFCAYRTPWGDWNTAIPTEGGATNTLDIYVNPTPPPPNQPPYTPYNPSPSNHATGVSIYADLSWSGGDPDAGDTVTYDVYFGVSPSPPLVSSGQSATTYDPGTLSYGTTYYWKIVAKDNHGASTTGPVWDFTTQPAPPPPNQPPYTPYNPSPPNHATGVSIYADLSWSGGDPDVGDTVTYDVYFGTSTPPPLVSNDQSATTYDPGTLSYSTTYYWKIVATDNHGASAEGPIWDFTSQSAPPNQPPYEPTAASQYRSDGTTVIPEGGATPESTVVFKATISDPEGDSVRLEIELRQIGEAFTGEPTPETISDFVPSGSQVIITRYDLVDGSYKWQYRARDSKGATSSWVEFGTQGNIDFITSEDVYWLAKAIMSEASVGTPEERAAVGWTVLNRLRSGGYGNSIKDIVTSPGQYATGQEPTAEIVARAKDLLEGKIPDPTDGATYFFSPHLMPKEGEDTTGFDVGGGLQQVPLDGQDLKVYFPSFAKPQKETVITEDITSYLTARPIPNKLEWRNLLGVRTWYFMFFRPYTTQIDAGLGSPGELRVYDSQGRVTGLVNGTVMIEIPGSDYFQNTVTIFFPNDTYRFVVAGTTEGFYGLTVTAVTRQENITFSAIDIPTLTNAIHQYTIDWDTLSLGEQGVTTQVDSDGDGVFEHTFTSDSELTQSEFLAQITLYTFSIVWGAETFVVSVESNSTVSNFAFNQPDKEISFNLTGEAATIGFCNVTIPKALLYGEPWTVLIDGAPVPATITENATYSCLYFTYTHSTHEAQIIGTWVIAPPPPTYSLTITTTVGGTTDPAPGAYTYTANSPVQVTAIPNADYAFDHWELDTLNVGSANPYTVLMDNNHTLKAVFTYSPPPPSLTASISPLSASILVGQSVTFTSTVSGGYTPYSYQWYLNGNPVSGATSNTWTFTPTTSGVYYVHLKVTDSKANTAQSETARVSVATVPVGGYSVPIDRYIIAKPLMLYFASVAILAIAFAVVRRKTPRKPK